MTRWSFLLVGLLAGSALADDNCEPIRADIEARIRAAGVPTALVTVLPLDAASTGKVVGSCDLGRKKIVYDATGAAVAAPPVAAPVLTECRDGSTPVDGRCKH